MRFEADMNRRMQGKVINICSIAYRKDEADQGTHEATPRSEPEVWNNEQTG